MPDYSQIYRQGLRAYEPSTEREVTGTLDPEKRYDLQFYSEPTDRTQVSPEQYEQAVQSAVADEQRAAQPQMPEAPSFTTVDDRAKYDYKVGELNAKNEYLEEMKSITGLQGSPQYEVMSQMAAVKYQSSAAELNMNKQKWEAAQRRINHDPNYDTQNKQSLKMQWYDKNKIFDTEEIDVPAAGRAFQRTKKPSRFEELGSMIAPPTEEIEQPKEKPTFGEWLGSWFKDEKTAIPIPEYKSKFPTPKTKEERDALRVGTQYMAPDGKIRIKR